MVKVSPELPPYPVVCYRTYYDIVIMYCLVSFVVAVGKDKFCPIFSLVFKTKYL